MTNPNQLGLIEKTALAQVLHSFYNRIENIFIVIAKTIDKQIPSGILRHKELLQQISEPTKDRPGIISENTREQLLEYLGFRHVVRHIYSTNLDPERIEGLALRMEKIWDLVKGEIETFLSL